MKQVGKCGDFPTFADGFFWYHIDYGFRLAPSGWDRLALLLDLAFNTGVGFSCNLKRVLIAITKKDPQIVQDTNFVELTSFRDDQFRDRVLLSDSRGIREFQPRTQVHKNSP